MTVHVVGKFLVGMTVIAACATVVTSLANTDERPASGTDIIVTTEPPSHRSGRMISRRNHDLSPSESSDNELGPTSQKKVSQRLIGGHLKLRSESENEEDDEDDLKEDEEDQSDGLVLSSAGNGQESKNGSRTSEDEDEKKTLSQQVKEGKYGLIQNEIYPEKPKRPGIISYSSNPEVPRDTAKNLGGLDEEDIWLAENHVLVLRGGRFPGHEEANEKTDGRQDWPPIDNYKAPKRQIKIPSQPKVPPPFPVQLTAGGPVQIIRATGANAIDNETAVIDYDAGPYPTEDFLPGEAPFYPLSANGSFSSDLNYLNNFTNQTSLGPFYPPLPPGAIFLPPPNNQTDYDDEDQSIYYPPPYSFYYQQDNTTAVPPGPLVPGIILPPPPDFFSSLDDGTTTTTEKRYDKRPTTSPVPMTHPTYLPPRRNSPKVSKVRVTTTKSATALPLPAVTTAKTIDRTKCRNATNAQTSVKRQPNRQGLVSRLETVTHEPEASRTVVNTNYDDARQVIGKKHVIETSGPGKSRWSAISSSTAVPILAYYATTPVSSHLEQQQSIDPTLVPVKSVITTRRPTRLPNQASYYFYDETNNRVASTPTNPAVYYQTTTESPYYRVEPLQQPKKEYYSVEMVPSEQTAKDYSSRLVNSLIKEPAVYRYSDSSVLADPTGYDSAGSSRTQGQRMLAEPAPMYYQALSVNHSPVPKSYYRTERPRYDYYRESQEPRYNYEREPKTKPVYQYSYEVADYSKQSERPYYQQQQQGEFSYGEYREVQSDSEQNDYDGSEPIPVQRLHHQQSLSYESSQRPASYPVTSVRPIVNATPNPQHAYYTKQEEQLLDDVTKEYFSIFGKKLQDKGLPSTTPTYGTVSSTTERPNYNANAYVANEYDVRQSQLYKTPKVKVRYGGEQGQRPHSLKDDTLVNYRNPLPAINPDSEFISVDKPLPKQQSQGYRISQVNRPTSQVASSQAQNYRTQPVLQPIDEPARNLVSVARPIDRAVAQEYRIRQEVIRPTDRRPAHMWNYGSQRVVDESSSNIETLDLSRETEQLEYPVRAISLEDDVAVNYRDPRPTVNPDAEFIDPIAGQDSLPNKASSYFAYQLPGDGGHFYFLTPQAIAQRQDESGRYLYPKPIGPRLVRRRRGPDNVRDS